MSTSIQPSAGGNFLFVADRDILKELLAAKRSPNTRRAYEGRPHRLLQRRLSPK